MQMLLALSERCSVLSRCSSPLDTDFSLNVPLELIAICKLDLLRVNFRENEEKHFAYYRTH